MTHRLITSLKLALFAAFLIAGFEQADPILAADKSDKGEKVEKTEKSDAAKTDTAGKDRLKSGAVKAVIKNDKTASKPQAAGSVITPAREAAALTFAQENHPELASLLEGLKRNAPKEYAAALTDLDRAVEKLGKLKEKSADRYEVELTEWKMASRIRLLAARMAMSSDPTLEAELRAALRERLEFRLTAQRIERDRFQVRVNKLDQQIDEMASKADAIVEKQFAELRTTLPATRPAKAKAKKVTGPADVKN